MAELNHSPGGAGRARERAGAPRRSLLGTLSIAAILCAALCSCGSADPSQTAAEASVTGSGASTSATTVSPLPGTQDASPNGQISFLGAQRTQVSEVSVVGSHSGKHSGHLEAYSTGTGESFLPSHPFTPGERVTVRARAGVGTPSESVSTTFTVAHQAAVRETEFALKPGNSKDIQHYRSAPSLTPSTVRISTPAKPGAAPGDFFLAPYQARSMPGPMIVDQKGNLVWFHPLRAGYEATNFHVQEYEGKPVLTWWQGRIIAIGFGQGEDVIYNTHYQQIATIRAGNGYHADLHEIRLTPQGTAWIDIFDPIHMNTAAEHGSRDGVLTDSVIEEVDIKTGLVMWEWHALGHIALGESNVPAPDDSYPWDYVHINSVDPGTSGDLLLSSRSTWTLYDVGIHTGAIAWRLGGSHSGFKQGAGTHFYWQHDAEWQPGGLVSIFDNGSTPPKEKQSRGLLMRPDLSSHTVTLVKQFTNPAKTLLASSQGNTLSLPGGDWLMGYGGLPNFTEYNSSGQVLFDATLGKEVQDFRTYLSPWSGQAPGSPAVAAQATGAGVTVEASWNGSTEVASWQVLAGASPTSLAPVSTVPKQGFETTIQANNPGPYVAVRALDASGNLLGTSSAIHSS